MMGEKVGEYGVNLSLICSCISRLICGISAGFLLNIRDVFAPAPVGSKG